MRERRGRRPITQLIDNGVPVGAYSTVTVRAARSRGGSIGNARRASHKSVPRAAPTCLILEPTTSLTNLMSDLAEAVYIQQLSGSSAGINPVTGRIDVGGIGWLLQAGQPVGRVETIAISTNLTAFLRSIVAIGDDADQVPFTPTAASTVVCDSELIHPSR